MMIKYNIEIVFSKSKPLIILTFDDDFELNIDKNWKKKFKKINSKVYHISTTIVQKVFENNADALGDWKTVRFQNNEVEQFYGFTKGKGMEVHSLDLTKRFVNDWLDEYVKLFRYTINKEDNDFPPIIVECLYDASVYSDGTVGNITEEEVNILKKIINPDGEIIKNMKAKLNENQ